MNSLSCNIPNKMKNVWIKMQTMDATLPSQSQSTICCALVCTLWKDVLYFNSDDAIKKHCRKHVTLEKKADIIKLCEKLISTICLIYLHQCGSSPQKWIQDSQGSKKQLFLLVYLQWCENMTDSLLKWRTFLLSGSMIKLDAMLL